jgi:hypothetical protein
MLLAVCLKRKKCPLGSSGLTASLSYKTQWLELTHNLGNPGWGKTVLASGVVEDFLTVYETPHKLQTVYFFFRYADPSSSTLDAAYRSALAQLLHRNRNNGELIDKFLFVKDGESSSAQLQASSDELKGLFKICAQYFGGLNFILDGVDESQEREEIGRKLKELVSEFPVKLICFSRPNIHSLQKFIPSAQCLTIERSNTADDIRRYLTNHIDIMVEEDMLPESEYTHLVENLLLGADGMFLWAKLMINLLSSPTLTPQARLETISSVILPEGLEQMYRRILMLVLDSGASSIDLGRRIFLWLSCAFGNDGWHYLDQLRTFLSGKTNYEQMCDSEFVQAVTTVCGGLVEFTPHPAHSLEAVPGSSRGRVRFVHMSVHEFFGEMTEPAIAGIGHLIPTVVTGHMEIALRCLEYLLSQAPDHQPSRFEGAWKGKLWKSLEAHQSFVDYAVRFWTQHVARMAMQQYLDRESTKDLEAIGSKLVSKVAQFLSTPMAVAAWIEGLYILQVSIPRQADVFETLARAVSDIPNLSCSKEGQMLVKGIAEFAKEIKDVDDEWGNRLLTTPSIIWDDVLSFQKSGILSKIQQSDLRLSTVALERPASMDGTEMSGNRCLCTISATSPDGGVTAVLSVWPSSTFEEFTNLLDPVSAYIEAEKYSHGWRLRYETWSTRNGKTRLSSLELVLEAPEVMLALRQSFRRNLVSGCQDQYDTSFPLAIGPDLATFAALRTVFKIDDVHHPDPDKLKSFTIPTQFLGHYSNKWSLEALPAYDPSKTRTWYIDRIAALSIRDWYTYTLTYSSSGEYLCFSDYHRPCVTHLAIFRILEDDCFRLEMVSSIATKIGVPRISLQLFHDTMPILGFCAEYKLWIWDFLER